MISRRAPAGFPRRTWSRSSSPVVAWCPAERDRAEGQVLLRDHRADRRALAGGGPGGRGGAAGSAAGRAPGAVGRVWLGPGLGDALVRLQCLLVAVSGAGHYIRMRQSGRPRRDSQGESPWHVRRRCPPHRKVTHERIHRRYGHRQGTAGRGGLRRGPACGRDRGRPQRRHLPRGQPGPRAVSKSNPVTVDTLFRIMSMTKMPSYRDRAPAGGAGQPRPGRARRGLLPGVRPDPGADRLRRGHPGLRPPARQATVKNLVTHTSGLGYWF